MAVAAGIGVSLGNKAAVVAGRVSVGRTGLLGGCVSVAAGTGIVVVGSSPTVKVPLQAVMNSRMINADKMRNFMGASWFGLDISILGYFCIG